ncbi:SMI1/KNR4 family protein [Streptomyces sp. NPDC006879]|uniref:SMI1/KNR4 family protein n=1 Tax=Streptomyces sp. NPDC006879 TaxID=3364767 RepID=UPI0036C2D690
MTDCTTVDGHTDLRGTRQVTALERVMPAVHGADERIDWAAVEAAWSTPFPSDYKAFMSLFGAGTINGEASVLLPLPKPGLQWEPASMAEETLTVRAAWASEGGAALFGTEAESVLAWGVTAGPDILCWLTADPDPERWPVLVYGRHTSAALAVHPFGMAEFLRRLFLDEFDECPVSLDFWDGAPPNFVHWLEAQRRWLAGRNPETGEPDPYAGEFTA